MGCQGASAWEASSPFQDRRATPARAAQAAGLEVNAGHDLSRDNLTDFLHAVPGVREVSIGHAFVSDALELGYNRRFSNNWFFSANYTLSRLYGNYSGLASSDEITTPTTGGSSATAQQQAGSIARPGGNTNRAWDSDELLWDSHGNVGLLGRLATVQLHRLHT